MVLIDLKEKLQEEFADTQIVTLSQLAKKIAVVAKVRMGSKRDVVDYYEVTLSDMDQYGVIVPDTTKAKPQPANSTTIASQRLRKNDLLVSYRGIDIKVGRIDREYEKPIVSNNSVIRIQFEDEDEDFEEDLSLFVQHYLQLPYVKAYIASRPRSTQNDRKILSPRFLSNLPIPLFDPAHIRLKDLLTKRLQTLHSAKDFQKQLDQLIQQLQKRKHNALSLYLCEDLSHKAVLGDDMQLLDAINMCQKRIDLLMGELGG